MDKTKYLLIYVVNMGPTW